MYNVDTTISEVSTNECLGFEHCTPECNAMGEHFTRDVISHLTDNI